MDDFINDVPHWKARLLKEGHSRANLQKVVSAPPNNHAEWEAAREILDDIQAAETKALIAPNFRWTRVATVAAVVGALATLWPLLRPAPSGISSHTSSQQTPTPHVDSRVQGEDSNTSTPLPTPLEPKPTSSPLEQGLKSSP